MQNYQIGQITDKQVNENVWKNVFQGKLTYVHFNKGEEMAPTLSGQGGTLLVRRLPTADPKYASHMYLSYKMLSFSIVRIIA
jgi:hypothetical protein